MSDISSDPNRPTPPEPAAAPAPLIDPEKAELWALIARGEAMTSEEHARATELHDQWAAHVAAWKPDIEAAAQYAGSIMEQIVAVLRHIVTTVPAVSGVAGMVNRMEQQHAQMQAATVAPTPPPEVPAPAPPPPAESLPALQPDHSDSPQQPQY